MSKIQKHSRQYVTVDIHTFCYTHQTVKALSYVSMHCGNPKIQVNAQCEEKRSFWHYLRRKNQSLLCIVCGPSVHLWPGISNWIIWRVLMKFGMGVLYENDKKPWISWKSTHWLSCFTWVRKLSNVCPCVPYFMTDLGETRCRTYPRDGVHL